MMFPAPPPDGGFLVLNDAQLDSLDLLCLIKRKYPRTKIYAQRKLSREAVRVMSIGNAALGPTGLLGYTVRNDVTLRALRSAMDKIKDHSF